MHSPFSSSRFLACLGALILSAARLFAQPAEPDEEKLEASIRQELMEREAAMRAEAISRLKQASLRLAETEDLLEKSEKELSLWKRDIEPLLENDEGRFLTADEKDVRVCYGLLMVHEPPAPAKVALLKEALDPLAQDIRAKSKSGDVIHALPESYMQALADLRAEAELFYSGYNQPRVSVQGLYARAKKTGRKGDLALGVAMSLYAAEHAEERAAVIERERLAAQQKNAETVAKVEAGRVRAQGDYEAAKIEAETRMTLSQAGEIGKDVDRELLRKRATSPEVLQALAPFVTKGRAQPTNISSGISRGISKVSQLHAVNFTVGDRFQPISFGFLARSGALQRSEVGQRKLLSVANASRNDRPHWPPPLSDEEWATVAEAQNLLIELGPYLVEAQQLLP